MQPAWWVLQDPLGLLVTQANRDLMGILALGAFLASWEPWVRLATQGPRVSAALRCGWGLGWDPAKGGPVWQVDGSASFSFFFLRSKLIGTNALFYNLGFFGGFFLF